MGIVVSVTRNRMAVATRLKRLPKLTAPLLRLNGLCPYYTMFPLTFPFEALAAADSGEWVFDPVCGRGTTILAARLRSLPSVGISMARILGRAPRNGRRLEPGVFESRSRCATPHSHPPGRRLSARRPHPRKHPPQRRQRQPRRRLQIRPVAPASCTRAGRAATVVIMLRMMKPAQPRFPEPPMLSSCIIGNRAGWNPHGETENPYSQRARPF